jgi:glycosyltransferase involved in cell wall biosynthesis
MFRSYHLIDLLKPALSVYYTRDNMMSVPYWYKHGRKLEPELMKRSDLVCANSTYLAAVARRYNEHSYYVGQGCDVSAFSPDKKREVPADIKDIAHPIIGYLGALFTLRLDLKLLENLARQKPEWNFVFVGPEDEAFKSSALHQMRNVFFPGLKDASVLPDYLACFDVAINPQIVNPTTIGNYPRKIDEYLAMGKPTVATKTEAMSIFSEHCYLASTPEAYQTLIEQAMHEDNEQRRHARIEFAKSHTWENSVDEIYKAIAEVRI